MPERPPISVNVDQSRYPNLGLLLDEVLRVWPGHAKALAKSIGERDPSLLHHTETLASAITRLEPIIDGGRAKLAEDFRFLCERIILPEELHFRRNGRYRLSRFEDALSEVYSDRPFMTRYMNGLLMSHVLWLNHARATQHYVERFLPGIRSGAEHLEIGPGHGLLLHLAAESGRVARLTGWDVAAASLDSSRHALAALGTTQGVSFECKDAFAAASLNDSDRGRFDSIVLSEVLEHLEQPAEALASLYQLCKPGGRVWINVPANSPAPDHLFLVQDIGEATALVEAAGFGIVETASYAMPGISVERAIRDKMTLNCVIVGERPAA